MLKIYEALKDIGVYDIATMDGDQPRVRTFSTIHLFEDKLYIQTGKKKAVSKQMHINPKVEICAFGKGKMVRITCKVESDERLEAKESMLEAYPGLKGMYIANDDNTEVFFLYDCHAIIESRGQILYETDF